MIGKLSAFVAVTLLSGSLEPVEKGPPGEVVTAAHPVVKQVLTLAERTRTVQAEFIQAKHMSMLQDAIVAPGSLRYEAPDRVRWEVQGERPMIILTVGEQVRVMQHGEEKKLGPGEKKAYGMINEIMKGLISGRSLTDPNMAPRYILEEDILVISLHPMQDMLAKRIDRIALEFDRVSGKLKRLTMEQPDGDSTEVTFSKVVLDAQQPAGSFTDL